MDILNYDEFKNFVSNITDDDYDAYYHKSVPISIWKRYVEHINRIMELDPSIRFTCNLDVLYIDFNIHKGYKPANYDKEYLFPRNFTLTGSLRIDLLNDIKIPDDLIVNEHIVFVETFVKNIPINLYNAKSVYFRTEKYDTIKKLENFYNEVVLPLESNFIIEKEKYGLLLKPK